MEEKRIGLDQNFIMVQSQEGCALKDGFGGNQSWLRAQIAEAGCGVVAAVNIYLYLTGKRNIPQREYIQLCNQYCKKHPVDLFLIRMKFGTLPISMGKEIKKRCLQRGIIIKKIRWNWKKGSDQYELMKKMLANDIPVLWGLHSYQAKKDANHKLLFYLYENDKYVPSCYKVESHYVVATAVCEQIRENGFHRRMIEVSSWGKRYYIDYDEYLLFVHTECRYMKLINQIGSNILVIS